MAKPQETPVLSSTYDDYYDTSAASGRGCFQRFCFGRDKDESHSYLLHDKEGGGPPPQPESWFEAQLKKLREYSELVAGPKWKNFIRKMGRICNTRKQNKTALESRYSPESYALNFSGAGHEEDEELLHSFSTRFATSFFINDQQRRPEL